MDICSYSKIVNFESFKSLILLLEFMTRPDRKAMRQMYRWMANRGLEPIKEMVGRGEVEPEMAITMLAHSTGNFSGESNTPDYKRFKENSGRIYANETFFDLSYNMSPHIFIPYKFAPPSRNDAGMLFKLYQHLSGKEYGSPEELHEIMRDLLQGKRVLELGCGPGFNLKVLKDLGANVSGVEKRGELLGGIPEVDVKHGDAQRLDDVFGDGKFDLIYSNDFFCLGPVLDHDESKRIVYATGEHTQTGGMGIHQIVYEKMNPMLYEFGQWIQNRKMGSSHEAWEEWFDGLSDAEQEDLMYTNRCSLDPQDLVRAGFRVAEYSAENGQLNIVANKKG